MSGPCTDCGGPGYQTLVARIAELEASANTSICIFCGTTMDKDLNVMLDHAKGCEKRPENNLLKRAEQAEAALAAEREALAALGRSFDKEHGQRQKAEAALAERDRMLRRDWQDYDEDGLSFDDWLANLRALAEEGSE